MLSDIPRYCVVVTKIFLVFTNMAELSVMELRTHRQKITKLK